MASLFLDYFRCPEDVASFGTPGDVSAEEGYFRFEDAICFGRCAGATPTRDLADPLPNVVGDSSAGLPASSLPFDLSEIVTNLREERYTTPRRQVIERLTSSRAARRAYYFARPLLTVGIRKHMQKLRLGGWQRIQFPAWPVDVTVEILMRKALTVALERSGLERLPFVWFWPDGAPSCGLMTHDVEGPGGRSFCSKLMDLDDSFGIPASFQVVPEALSGPSDALVVELRRRGFEVNIHDFNHDGSLFHDRPGFERRVALINRYAREMGCRGFRSGAMYREQSWYRAFDIAYDMSVPNVAHLEPQRGGCCTVMPYFVGDVLELPLTTTQDYSLFHILNDYTTNLWERQIDRIRSEHGLVSFIAHPDYLLGARARATYVALLERLSTLRDEGQLWMALPAEVDRWWRDRRQMMLVRRDSGWRIAGSGSERARVAYASMRSGRLVYEMEAAAA